MSRAQLTSTDQQNSGGPVSPYVAGKNKIINGDFGIWQRGTSFTSPSNVYTCDRFVANGATSDVLSQQTFTPGAAPVAGYESTYFARFAASANAGTRYFFQRVEDVRTLSAQTVTFSFWAKTSSGTTTLTTYFYQQFGSGGSADVQSSTQTFTATTSWQRFSFTITMPSVSGKTIGAGSCVQAAITFTDTSKNIDTWGWQLEAGSVATPFTTATGTLSGELAACQRYYWRWTSADNQYEYLTAVAAIATTTLVNFFLNHPVPMRTIPSAVDSGGTAPVLFTTSGLGPYSISAYTINQAGILTTQLQATSSGMTAGLAGAIRAAASTTSYVGLSAEL